MKRSSYLFAGIIGSFILSAYFLIIVPQKQIGGLQPQYEEDEGKIVNIYPIENAGITKAGRAVYVSEG